MNDGLMADVVCRIQLLIRRMFMWEFGDRPAVRAVLADSWFMPPSPPAAATDHPNPPQSSTTAAPVRRVFHAPQSPAASPVIRTLVTPRSAMTGARRCLQTDLDCSTATQRVSLAVDEHTATPLGP